MIGDILQPTHLLFILIVALVVLGPKRLPEVARTLGNGLRDFRAAINGDSTHDEEDRYEIPDAHTRQDLSHEDVGRVDEPEPPPETAHESEPAEAHAPQPEPAHEPQPEPAQEPEPPATGEPQPPAAGEPQPAAAGEPQPPAAGEPHPAAADQPAPAAPHEPTPTSPHKANGAESTPGSTPDQSQHADKSA